MNFKPIHHFDSDLFRQYWVTYLDTFSTDECRDLNSQKIILKKKEYHLQAILEKDNILGFISFWELDDFIFIEHFVILKSWCGQGYGTEALNKFIMQSHKEILLEVEKPETDLNKRRIRFYKNMGFHLNGFEYEQPAYSSEKKSIYLLLMSYPNSMNELTFLKRRNMLYTKVYQI